MGNNATLNLQEEIDREAAIEKQNTVNSRTVTDYMLKDTSEEDVLFVDDEDS